MTGNKLSAIVAATAFLAAMAIQTMSASAQAVSESANEILHNMSDYFGKLAAFSMDYDADTEIITGEGQKLQLGASGKIVIRRPDGAYITRDGPVASTETFYDGKMLTLFGKKINSYYQVGSSDGLDAAIDHFRMETGMDAPGADLLLQDPYSVLIDGVQSGEYISDDYVDGVQCYHLAFREADVDWQLWVRADDHPVPMKYVITTKWLTGAPQYSIRLRNWNFEPQISDETFRFVPPEGAFKMDHIEVSQTGELKLVGAQ